MKTLWKLPEAADIWPTMLPHDRKIITVIKRTEAPWLFHCCSLCCAPLLTPLSWLGSLLSPNQTLRCHLSQNLLWFFVSCKPSASKLTSVSTLDISINPFISFGSNSAADSRGCVFCRQWNFSDLQPRPQQVHAGRKCQHYYSGIMQSPCQRAAVSLGFRVTPP